LSLNKDYFRDYLIQKDYYHESSKYNPYDEGKYRSWTRFQQKRPNLARLLVILFGGSASDVHLEVTPIPEEKARLLVSLLETYPIGVSRIDNLHPVGDC
jgi:hypothetical protein